MHSYPTVTVCLWDGVVVYEQVIFPHGASEAVHKRDDKKSFTHTVQVTHPRCQIRM